MPDYWVEPYEPEDILWFQGRQIRLNKVPKQGSWFDLGDGTPAQAKVIRIIGGEPVIDGSLLPDDFDTTYFAYWRQANDAHDRGGRSCPVGRYRLAGCGANYLD